VLFLSWLIIVSLFVTSCNVSEIFAPTPTPTPSPSPTATATPAPLTSSQIFNLLSPSIAFVDTPTGTGSGVLIHEGYVLTNAHVVWPFKEVRIVFPGGEEFLDIPVRNWDLLGDLAILGPIETEIPPLELVDGEDLVIGSDVFLIGYPGEVDNFPQPTITRGIISRMRQWEPTEVTYFQTDATISGGQSGGVFVSELGQVIGISNFSFSGSDFGLVASAADVLPRVDSLIAGENLAGLGNREIPFEGGQKSFPSVFLQNEWDNKVYIINEPKDTEIKIRADSSKSDVAFGVWDFYGRDPMYVNKGYIGSETATFVTKIDAPYIVELYQDSSQQPISIEASHDLIPFVDLDDGRGLSKDASTTGHLDYPGDVDRFQLILKAGETVNILVDSLLIDPILVIARPWDKEEQFVIDDNSGKGIFGVSAEVTFTAPTSNIYYLVIADASGNSTGGYSLQVREPYDGAPTPMSPKPIPTPIKSEFGAMATYSSDITSFSIQYPATWSDDPTSLGEWQAFCTMATACFAGDALLAIVEEDLSALGNPTLEEYVDFYVNAIGQSAADIRLLSRKEFVTATGLSGEVVVFDFGGIFQMKRFIYVQNGLGFNATYVYSPGQAKDLDPLIEYTFSTFDSD
jgi:hypothetical protein